MALENTDYFFIMHYNAATFEQEWDDPYNHKYQTDSSEVHLLQTTSGDPTDTLSLKDSNV